MGVVGCHLGHLGLRPALGHVQRHAPAAPGREPALHRLGIRKRAGHADLSGDIARLVVVALHEAVDQLLLAHVEALVEHELAGTAHAALAHHEHAGARDGLLAPEPDDVGVLPATEHHALLVVEPVDDGEAAFHAPSPLEVEVRGGLGHLGLELGHELAAMTREEALHLRHVAGILLGRDAARAHAGPASHVVVEAGAAVLGLGQRHDVALLGMRLDLAAHALPLGAGGDAQRHHLAHHVDHGARGAGIGVGAKVARLGAVTLARVLDGREDVAFRERDVGVALVVLEVDVEGRAVLVDEVDLEDEGLVLGAHDHVVEACRGRHEARHHGTFVGELHVLAHAGAQVLGLAHVEHVALGVLPEVAARVGGNERHLLGDGGQVGGTRSGRLARGRGRRGRGARERGLEFVGIAQSGSLVTASRGPVRAADLGRALVSELWHSSPPPRM